MRAMAFGRVAAGGICAALVLGGVVVGPASAAACDSENLNPRADFDGDGSADIAVGMPGQNDGSGVVDVRGTGSPALVLTAGALGAGTGEGDRFGAAIAIGDLDQDGCADLVIGAPAEGQSAASDGAGNNEGQVHIVFGGAGGLDLSTSITLPHDSSNLDHFGITLALVKRYEASTTRTVHDLYVGAPRATVGGHDLAGEVFRYTLAADSAERVTATLREVRSQDSAGVPGSAEAGDGFGSVLASIGLTDRSGVLVGAPEEDIGSVRDAGGVWFLPIDAAGATATAWSWSQDTSGVPGTAEKDDHFGSALGARGATAVVGVPDENEGAKADTGMVQVFEASQTGPFVPGALITQNTAGIPGTVEAADRFGAAVAVGVNLVCQESVDVAVGAPGENIGTRSNAGSVTLIALGEDTGCPARVLRQGSGLAGAIEKDDEVGSVLGLTRGSLDAEEDYVDRLLIGVPKEDLGAEADAGMVQPSRGGISAGGVTASNLQYSKGYLQTNYYGGVLSSPAAD